jgi:hypothetical protein
MRLASLEPDLSPTPVSNVIYIARVSAWASEVGGCSAKELPAHLCRVAHERLVI